MNTTKINKEPFDIPESDLGGHITDKYPELVGLDIEGMRSSQMKFSAYDIENFKLHIMFQNNQLYTYYPVDAIEYRELMEAKSQGKYFHANLSSRLQKEEEIEDF